MHQIFIVLLKLTVAEILENVNCKFNCLPWYFKFVIITLYIYKQTKCNCCTYRYATEEYSNGFYCTQCASDQPNKGSFVDDDTPMLQLFVSNSNDNIIINNHNAITGQCWTIWKVHQMSLLPICLHITKKSGNIILQL